MHEFWCRNVLPSHPLHVRPVMSHLEQCGIACEHSKQTLPAWDWLLKKLGDGHEALHSLES